MSRILIAGHFCHDTLIHVVRNGANQVKETDALGGSATFISAVLSSLKVPFEVASRVGSDFKYGKEILGQPIVSEKLPTTHFVADFTHGERILSLRARCEDILEADVPAGKFDVAMACGLIGEITPEAMQKMASQAKHLVCDVQGLIRDVNAHGKLIYRRLEDTPYFELLPRIHMLKASVFEAAFMDIEKVSARTMLVITEGDGGSTIHYKGNRTHVRPYPAEEVDSTGAGDCFMAGFAYGLLQGFEHERCAMIGNYCGAQAVKAFGVPRISSEELINLA